MDFNSGPGRAALFGYTSSNKGGMKRKFSSGIAGERERINRRMFKEPGAVRHRLYSPGKASESYHMSRSPQAKSRKSARGIFDFF